MKPLYIILFAIIFILGALYYRSHPLVSKVRIRNTTITVDVAVTDAQKQRGLGGRSSMAENSGMLFPYDHTEQFEYWMRDMLFPLDFVWINGKTVVDLSPNIPAPKQGEMPRIVKPKTAVDKVLELHAGSIERIGIATGDAVLFLDR